MAVDLTSHRQARGMLPLTPCELADLQVGPEPSTKTPWDVKKETWIRVFRGRARALRPTAPLPGG